MKSLIDGIERFQTQIYPTKKALFEKLAGGQSPSALVIACADSRVDIQMLTQSEPGELFVVRNAGNIVPCYGTDPGAVSAAIEFAMVAISVPHIIVCGHSDCGAMRGLLDPSLGTTMPAVAHWLRYAEAARALAASKGGPDDSRERLALVTHENIVQQIRHLETHPSVASRLARGEVQLHGWYFDIGPGRVTAYDAGTGEFQPVATGPRACTTSALPRPRPFSSHTEQP